MCARRGYRTPNCTVDCNDCEDGTKKSDMFDCTVELKGNLDDQC